MESDEFVASPFTKVISLELARGGFMAATRLDSIQHNERIKAISSVMLNGGLALVGAFSAIIYNGGGTDSALGMAIVGGILMFLGSVAMPRLLRDEEVQ